GASCTIGSGGRGVLSPTRGPAASSRNCRATCQVLLSHPPAATSTPFAPTPSSAARSRRPRCAKSRRDTTFPVICGDGPWPSSRALARDLIRDDGGRDARGPPCYDYCVNKGGNIMADWG